MQALLTLLAEAAVTIRNARWVNTIWAGRGAVTVNRALTAVETLTVIDFGADLYAGEDVFLDAEWARALGLGSLGFRGVRTLAAHQDLLKTSIKNAASSAKEAAKVGGVTAVNATNALKNATGPVAAMLRNPGELLQVLVASNLPRIARIVGSTRFQMGKGAVFQVIRDAKAKSYFVIGRSGAILGSLSKSGFEVSSSVRKSAGYAAVFGGTAVAIDMLDSDDEGMIEAIASFLNAMFSMLVPEEATYESRGYSDLLDAHATEVLADMSYHISRVARISRVSDAIARDIVGKEIITALRRCDLGTSYVSTNGSVASSAAADSGILDSIGDFFGFNSSNEVEVGPEAIEMYRASSESAEASMEPRAKTGGNRDDLGLR